MKYNIDVSGLFGKLFPFLIPIAGQWRPAPKRYRTPVSRYLPHQGISECERRVRQRKAIEDRNSPRSKLLVLQNKKTGDMMSFTLQK